MTDNLTFMYILFFFNSSVFSHIDCYTTSIMSSV